MAWMGRGVPVLLVLGFAVSAGAQPVPAVVPPDGAAGSAAGLGGTVRLPWGEFLRMVEQVRRLEDPVVESPPPVDGAVTSAVLRITVDADEQRAQVEADLDVVVLREGGWVEVPLLPDAAALQSFTVEGGTATVVQRDGFHRLVARAGYFAHGALDLRKVRLAYRVNVAAEAGPRTLTLPVTACPVTRLEISIPKTDQDLRVEPDGVIIDRTVEEAVTRVTALVPRSSEVRVRWSDRAAPVREEPLRAVAEVVHRVAFQRHVASGEAAVALQVQRGSFEAIVVRFPAGVEGIRAGGDFAVDVEPAGDAFQLAWIRLGYARRDGGTFVLRYEIPRHVGALAPPDVKVVKLIQEGQDRELVRQSGFLALYADEGMEVAADGPPEGAEPCDVSELPGGTELPGSPVLAFRTSGLPADVPLRVTRHEERAVLASAVQSALLELVVNGEGRGVGDLSLWVQNNERQFVGIELPPRATLWATFVAGRPVKPSGTDEWILVPVPRSVIRPDGSPEAFQVELIYYEEEPRIDGWWGSGRFALPKIDLLVSEYTTRIYVPDGFRYFGFEGEAEPRHEEIWPVADDSDSPQPPRPAARAAPAAEMVEPTLAYELPPEAAPADLLESEEEVEGEAGKRAEKDRVDNLRQRESTGRLENRWAADEAAAGNAFRAPASTRGLLPIRIDVPRQGLVLEFRRSLVEPQGSTTVDYRYQALPVTYTFPWLRWLTGLLFAFAVARMVHRTVRARRLSLGWSSPAAFTAGLALLVVLALPLGAPLHQVAPALLVGLVLYAAGVGGRWGWERGLDWWKARGRPRAGTVPPPLPEPPIDSGPPVAPPPAGDAPPPAPAAEPPAAAPAPPLEPPAPPPPPPPPAGGKGPEVAS